MAPQAPALRLTKRVRVEPAATKGSRFIATAAPALDEAAARSIVAELRAEMPDATHHCSAWRIAVPVIERAHDDGEPSGSAGRPILAQLQGRNIVNTAVIVTRFYGGTKLGVGGLVRAYGGAAAAALDVAVLEAFVATVVLRITHGYADGGAVEQALTATGARERHVEFAADVHREVELPRERLDDLRAAVRDATRGRAIVREDSASE